MRRKGNSSAYLPVYRELMDGENQYKDKHELQPWSIFFVVWSEICMKEKTVIWIVNNDKR